MIDAVRVPGRCAPRPKYRGRPTMQMSAAGQRACLGWRVVCALFRCGWLRRSARSTTRHGQIYINGQSWAVLSGFASAERARRRWIPCTNALNTPNGIKLSAPGFNGFDPQRGRHHHLPARGKGKRRHLPACQPVGDDRRNTAGATATVPTSITPDQPGGKE